MSQLAATQTGRTRYVQGQFAAVGDTTEPLALVGPELLVNIPAAGWTAGGIQLQMRPRTYTSSSVQPWQVIQVYTNASFANGAIAYVNAGADYEYQLVANPGFTGTAQVFIGGGQVQ
jgi:hypothetical protein